MPRRSKVIDERTFDVTVWDMLDGDIVKKIRNATESEANAIEQEFLDDPMRAVSIEER